MAQLPTKPLAQDIVVIDGTEVEFRALSRAEAIKLQGFHGLEDEAERFIIEKATGCAPEEAQAFLEGNDTVTAGLLVNGILILSGLAKQLPDGSVVAIRPDGSSLPATEDVDPLA